MNNIVINLFNNIYNYVCNYFNKLEFDALVAQLRMEGQFRKLQIDELNDTDKMLTLEFDDTRGYSIIYNKVTYKIQQIIDVPRDNGNRYYE